MEKHFALTNEEFKNQFADCILDASLFTHEAHLRLAWIHIHRYGIDEAIDNITIQLQRFVATLGASDKYNHTVTIAAIRAVYHFMLKSATTNFDSFITENARLKTSFRQLLASHYTTDLFTSTKAKTEYMEPELIPFD